MKRRSLLSTVAAILALAPMTTAQSAPSVRTSLGRLPLYFVANGGVYPESVRYSIQGADKTLFFTDGGVTIAFRGQGRGWTVKLDFVGARNDVRPEGRDRQAAVFSYFTGPEKDWKAGLRTFSRVVYRDLWPGIDLVYSGNVNELKYEFVVAPGADPSKIRLRYRGAASVKATDSGALRVETPEGSFEDAPPVAWQAIDGKRVPVAMAYALGDSTGEAVEFGFRIGDYDRTRSLILDPAVIVYCGYIGGAINECAFGIALDGARNTYLTGFVGSDPASFPVTVGPNKTYAGQRDAFVAKVNAAGTGLIYCGYIGGEREDRGNAITVDGSGCAYVTGFTLSTLTFPVTVGPDLTHNGMNDAFVAKVNAAGTGLDYCGYIGGARADVGSAIAVDGQGNAYVAGRAASDHNSFPVKVGPDLPHNGGIGSRLSDAFVAKVNAAGTGLVYCGYIGGDADDRCHGIAVDSAGNAYVAGFTVSTENTFPVKLGPDLTHNGGVNDAFVARVNAAGTSLDYCGYIGGAQNDWAYGIALDAANNAIVTGATDSDEKSFPVRVGPDLTHNGGSDAYVAKVDPNTAKLIYCGYIGGAGAENGYGIAVDGSGCAYVAGETGSDEQTFPVKVGPDLTANGRPDAFVAKVGAAGTDLSYCGYIGGAAQDSANAIAVDTAGRAYVAGYTESSETTFPVRTGPDSTYNGVGDAFVAQVTPHDDLTSSGTPRPGGTITWNLAAMAARGLPYQMATSLKPGSIPIDTRSIGLDLDDLFVISAAGLWPAVFQGYAGRLDGQGKAMAGIVFPNDAGLIGAKTYSAYVTFDPTWPSSIRSISTTATLTVTR